MKRLIFAVLAAAGILLGGAGAALASNGPPANSNSADNVHFTATYTETNSLGQPVLFTCAGEHIATSSQVREEENCALSGPGLSNYVKGDYGSLPGVDYGTFPGFPPTSNFTWFSDFNGVFATTWSIHVNGDLSSLHLSATYPS